jgi:predicted PhzF superfamily epimerase YddE/YHI9
MPAFRYVVADVFTAAPLEGNGVAFFTDACELWTLCLVDLTRCIRKREIADNAFDPDPQVRWPRIW